MVSLQVPGDAQLAEMIGATQVKDFLLDMFGCTEFWILRARFGVDQGCLTLLVESAFPLIEDLARDAEAATSFRDVACLFSVIKDAKFARDVALLLNGHHFPPVVSFYFRTNLSTEEVIFILRWIIDVIPCWHHYQVV